MKILGILIFLLIFKSSFSQRPTQATDPLGYETIIEIEKIDTSRLTYLLKGKLQFESLKKYLLNDAKYGYSIQLMDQAKYLNVSQIDSLYNLWDTSVQRKLLSGINSMKKRASFLPGNYLPELILTDSLSNKQMLSDFKGKIVFIDIWASWCEPCRQEMPHLKELAKKYSKKDLLVITISMDSNKQKWLKAIKDDHLPMNWKYYSDLVSYDDNNLYKEWGINGIPYNYLLDKEGKLINKQISLEQLDRILEKL